MSKAIVFLSVKEGWMADRKIQLDVIGDSLNFGFDWDPVPIESVTNMLDRDDDETVSIHLEPVSERNFFRIVALSDDWNQNCGVVGKDWDELLKKYNS